jgi:hypothetical protein
VSRRVELGIEGGGVLVVTVEESDVIALHTALSGERAWHHVASAEGENMIDLARVTYVRMLPGTVSRVGFGGSA